MYAFINNTTQVDGERGIIQLSPIFHCYAADFGGREGILDWITYNLSNGEAQDWLTLNGDRARIRYSRYDWALNGGNNGAI